LIRTLSISHILAPKKARSAWRLHRSHTRLRITAAEGRRITGRRGDQGWPAQISTANLTHTDMPFTSSQFTMRSYIYASPTDQAVPTAFVRTHIQRFSGGIFFFFRKNGFVWPTAILSRKSPLVGNSTDPRHYKYSRCKINCNNNNNIVFCCRKTRGFLCMLPLCCLTKHRCSGIRAVDRFHVLFRFAISVPDSQPRSPESPLHLNRKQHHHACNLGQAKSSNVENAPFAYSPSDIKPARLYPSRKDRNSLASASGALHDHHSAPRAPNLNSICPPSCSFNANPHFPRSTAHPYTYSIFALI